MWKAHTVSMGAFMTFMCVSLYGGWLCDRLYVLVIVSVVMKNSWDFHFCFIFIVLALQMWAVKVFFSLPLCCYSFYQILLSSSLHIFILCESLHLTKRPSNTRIRSQCECLCCTKDNYISRFYITKLWYKI